MKQSIFIPKRSTRKTRQDAKEKEINTHQNMAKHVHKDAPLIREIEFMKNEQWFIIFTFNPSFIQFLKCFVFLKNISDTSTTHNSLHFSSNGFQNKFQWYNKKKTSDADIPMKLKLTKLMRLVRSRMYFSSFSSRH